MIKVDLIGFNKYLQRIKEAKAEVKSEVSAELESAARTFVQLSKRDIVSQSSDTGGLLNSTDFVKVNEMDFEVFANKFYAPFIEFGTKGKYQPYPGTEEFAAQFKGFSRGTFKEMMEAIKAWVERKGIASGDQVDETAFLIARSILKNGISAKPFFFKQITPVRNQLEKRVEAVLNGL